MITWRCRDRTLSLGSRTLIMGVLNVTPDSFSDGGRYTDPAAAVAHALAMAEAGADLLDIGGESTRPGAAAVPEDEEIARVRPVIAALRDRTAALLSVDTSKAGVAHAALEAGAHLVNDVTALTGDPAMPDVVRACGAGAILMHMQGTPRTMQQDPHYDDVATEVADCLARRVEELTARGLARETLAVDPGIGFGKTVAHNLELLRRLDLLVALGRPVVVGVSRKSFLGQLTGRAVGDRLAATLGAGAAAIWRGAHLLRVHDVKESCDLARVVDMLKPG